MEGIAVTHRGMEDLARLEIARIINKDAKKNAAALTFPIDKINDLCTLSYHARVLGAVMLKIAVEELKEPEDLENMDPGLFKEWITEDKTFSVRCRKIGDHSFSSREVEEALGGMLDDKLPGKVKLTNPDVRVLVFVIDRKYYIGIDFAGIDLSKRPYRIFSYGDTLKGTVAQGMNYIAELKSEDRILDPFSSAGLISIEAALFLLNKSVHEFTSDDFIFTKLDQLNHVDFDKFFEDEKKKQNDDKLRITCSDTMQKHVKAAEKNAKIAGVNKSISFTRMDVDWLDTKFREGSIDKIITHPPQIGRRMKSHILLRIFDEFFYVAKTILSKEGLIVMVFNKPELLEKPLEKHGFKIYRKRDVWQGKEMLHILTIKRS